MDACLKNIILTDERVIKSKQYSISDKVKDPTHYQRRKQQRAITEEMVQLCLTYGEKKRIRGALTYTILDKNLFKTSYKKYIDKLRGLRVVLETSSENQLSLLTTYWVTEVKKKPSKKLNK